MDCRKLKWCFRQKKGIKLVKPSDNLCEAYLQKAKEAVCGSFWGAGWLGLAL